MQKMQVDVKSSEQRRLEIERQRGIGNSRRKCDLDIKILQKASETTKINFDLINRFHCPFSE